MSANPWHRRYHSDALSGMLPLTLEERGAYQTVLDLIYDRGGPIADNERLLSGYMGCSIRKWRSLRAALIEKGKLATRDGHLTNFRAEKEIENETKTRRKRAETGAKGGRKKSENQKIANKNNETDVAPLEQNSSSRARSTSTSIITPLPPCPELEGEAEPPQGGGGKNEYAFSGRTIRLTQADLDRWRKAYHAIPDLVAELHGLDDWLKSASEDKRKSWYFTVSAALGRKHQRWLRGDPMPEGGRRYRPSEPESLLDHKIREKREREEWARQRAAAEVQTA